jgi:hypothetical protein
MKVLLSFDGQKILTKFRSVQEQNIKKRVFDSMLGASINSFALPFSASDLRTWLKPKGW